MPIPANCARVVLAGSSAGGEDWSTGFWLSSGAPAQTILDAIDNEAVEPFFTTISDAIFTTWTFRSLSVYSYAAGGNAASSQAVKAENIAGQQNTNGSPFSTALVVSLLSGRPGRSGRGRMYLPYHRSIGGTGHVSGTDPALFGGAVNTMLSTIRGNADGLTPVIMSRTHTELSPITSVRVDDLPDTQRRRDADLVPANVYAAPLASS